MSHAPSQMRIARLRCEYLVDPIGISETEPRLSWILESPVRGERQTAYQILAASSAEILSADRGDLWDSGMVQSDQTAQIVYAGRPLGTGERAYWKVRIWDRGGRPSAYSDPACWEMGLLRSSDWQGDWISAEATPGVNLDGVELPPTPYLRREFALDRPVRSARLYATARGVYEMHLNGQRVGDAVLAPGWTDYNKRIQFQTYDVTELLQTGGNAWGAILADGWYSGYIGWQNLRHHYGDHPQMLAQLTIEFEDGTSQSVATEEGWVSATGPITYSDMLQGERYDARREMPGWDTPGFDASSWTPVRVEPQTAASVPLTAQPDLPIRVLEEIAPRAISEPTPGAFVFDMGQNMVGWARLRVRGSAGDTVQMRFAEVLNPDGTLYVTNLRGARATDIYVLKGGQEEIFEPRFTFHGFRYVEVTGYPGAPSLDAITGRVISSDTPPAGTFTCSDAMVNQLQHNIVWGQKGNFISIPTDCPQRDERMGWMGDAQIFIRTATCNRDVAAFFTKWMQDVEDAQLPSGAFADVSPRLSLGVLPENAAPAWGDAGVICPWTVYQVYGDTRILDRHYAAMAHWIEHLRRANPNLLWTEAVGNNYGDWLSIEADTPKDVLATAYFAFDTQLMARMAQALERTEDAAQYAQLFEQIKAAFNAAFVAPDGRIKGDTQTCYVLALRMGLAPDSLRTRMAEYLVADIEKRGGHLSTGFVGVGYLCPTLSDLGYDDLAYKLLLNTTFPSWGYSIAHGATTIWERWDGWTKEKGFQDPGMNSFNHYSLGSVGEWLYRYVAGIDVDPEKPGYRHIRIHPHVGGGLRAARAEFESIRGLIVSDWTSDGGAFTLAVTVPANTTATITLPAPAAAVLTEGGAPVAQAEGVTVEKREADRAVLSVGSGTYQFQVR